MKTVTINGKEVLFCEVLQDFREGIYRAYINLRTERLVIHNILNDEDAVIKLPPGSWHLLGLASEIKEEQWAELVSQIVITHSADGIKSNYWCWENYAEDNLICHTPTESGLSLLKAHGYKEETTLILVKQ